MPDKIHIPIHGSARDSKLEGRPISSVRVIIDSSDTIPLTLGNEMNGAERHVKVLSASPWKDYSKIFDILGPRQVSLATARVRPYERVLVKRVDHGISQKELCHLQEFRDMRLLLPRTMYDDGSHIFLIIDDVRLSLLHLILSPIYPDGKQLGSIVRQMLEGIAYLHKHGFVHGMLTSGNVVLTAQGHVKIDDLELCKRSYHRSHDIESIHTITLQLLQKPIQADSKCETYHNIQDISDVKAADFVKACSTSESADDLLKHVFFQPKQQVWSLVDLYESVWMSTDWQIRVR